jgi:hypothetical protein
MDWRLLFAGRQPGAPWALAHLNATAGKTGPATDRDVLAVMSTATGIPPDFLDDAVPLDRNASAFRQSWGSRRPWTPCRPGDLITVDDGPEQTVRRLLFVGPTGGQDGAKALAELLFGDSGRCRHRHSEFATSTPRAADRSRHAAGY